MIRSFLLRCWQEEPCDSSEKLKFRFALTELEPQRTWKGFDSLEQLFNYLREELTRTDENTH